MLFLSRLWPAWIDSNLIQLNLFKCLSQIIIIIIIIIMKQNQYNFFPEPCNLFGPFLPITSVSPLVKSEIIIYLLLWKYDIAMHCRKCRKWNWLSEKTACWWYDTFNSLLFIIRFIRKVNFDIFNCLYCNIVAEKTTTKNYMQTFPGVP